VIRIPLLGPNLHPAVTAGIIALADAVIEVRFRALVLAEARGTRCMGFNWEPKSAALIRERTLPIAATSEVVRLWLDTCRSSTRVRNRYHVRLPVSASRVDERQQHRQW
jgi:polysaccharide pyruvyl transferase WcaK-like protein